jgi:hypothetical protein
MLNWMGVFKSCIFVIDCIIELHCRTLKTLKTSPSLSLALNSSLDNNGDVVPIYSLEAAGNGLVAGDEGGRVHFVHRWFDNDDFSSSRDGPMCGVNVTSK